VSYSTDDTQDSALVVVTTFICSTSW